MRLRPLMLLSLRGDYVRSTPATHDEVMSALKHRDGIYYEMEKHEEGEDYSVYPWLLVTLTDADEDGSYLAIPVKE